jgi:hypothetical protein
MSLMPPAVSVEAIVSSGDALDSLSRPIVSPFVLLLSVESVGQCCLAVAFAEAIGGEWMFGIGGLPIAVLDWGNVKAIPNRNGMN